MWRLTSFKLSLSTPTPGTTEATEVPEIGEHPLKLQNLLPHVHQLQLPVVRCFPGHAVFLCYGFCALSNAFLLAAGQLIKTHHDRSMISLNRNKAAFSHLDFNRERRGDGGRCSHGGAGRDVKSLLVYTFGPSHPAWSLFQPSWTTTSPWSPSSPRCWSRCWSSVSSWQERYTPTTSTIHPASSSKLSAGSWLKGCVPGALCVTHSLLTHTLASSSFLRWSDKLYTEGTTLWFKERYNIK